MARQVLSAVIFLSSVFTGMSAQVLFTENGAVFTIVTDESGFAEVQIDPANGAITMNYRNHSPNYTINALGYRRTDRLIYGIHGVSRNVIRLDAAGATEDLGAADINLSMNYHAGDISPDGKTFVVIGSVNAIDQRLYLIDLETPGFPSTEVVMPGVSSIVDITFDPTIPDLVYGYDALNRSLLTINMSNFGMDALSEIAPDNDVFGVYFDAFGRLKALGTSTGGVAGALFTVDKGTGELTAKATGPVNRITDLASIPFSVEMECEPSDRVVFPCEEIIYSFSIVNRTNQVHSGVEFDVEFPAGIEFRQVASNPLGGTITSGTPGHLQIKNMNLFTGQHLLQVKAETANIPSAQRKVQGRLLNLPERYGFEIHSDDPATSRSEDSTQVQLLRIEEDSLFFSLFLCIGESLFLDGSYYGNDLLWSTGSKDAMIEVTAGGQYHLQVQGGCQNTVVVFNVTAATCPFTIEIEHEMIPEETVPCSEVLFRFTFDNASGAIRKDLVFADTLPEGLEFAGVASNAIGGTVVNGGSPRHVLIEDIDLPVGVFVLDLKIKVGDIAPGVYRNQAVLHNIPTELGPRRFSDDPTTPELDGTPLTVLGVETDTLYVQEIICDGSTLVLDGSPYGRVFEWFNGDTSATTEVTRPGVYRLIIWDGCEPTYIFFDVDPAAKIEATFETTVYYIHLGDSVQLAPLIINDGDSLFINWYDPRPVSLDCDSCLGVTAFPRKNAEYTLYASNEHCTDSVSVRVYVDNERFLFVPTIFTPNEDGINDRIAMYSPDPGWIESFDVVDRWGNVIFHTNTMLMNDASTGWDGTFKGDVISTGVYLWSARVRFLDDEVEWFSGDVSLVR